MALSMQKSPDVIDTGNAWHSLALISFLVAAGLSAPAVSAFAGAEPDGPQIMRGMYLYMADAAIFTECQTGRPFPVAMEGDNRALERAYLEMRQNPGEALLVTLEGRIVERMPMEGPGPVATLLPEKFLGISPGDKCASSSR